MLPGTLERPGLVGPRNETVDEAVGPFGEWSHEVVDRPLWKANDGTLFAPWEESRDDEDVGPLGESRDDEDVGQLGESRDDEDVGPFGELRDDEDIGPLGESRDEDEVDPLEESSDEDQDGLSQSHEEEEKVASPEDMNELLQLAATSVSMMPTKTGDASSSHATATLPTEPQEPLTSSPDHLASTLTTPSRKRGRDSGDDAQDGESPSQQKRMRMDHILGIVRQDVKSAEVPQNAGPRMALDEQRCAKRARSLEDGSEDVITQPTPKRVRLYLRVEEICGEEEYITAGQDAPTNAAAHEQASIVEEPSTNGETEESDEYSTDDESSGDDEGSADDETSGDDEGSADDDTSADDEASADDEVSANDEASAGEEASATETKWDTAHGVNCTSANIRTKVPIFDVNGAWTYLCLPTCTGSPDRAWTEEEMEDLRVYIQDYGIRDWELLFQSTNRPVKELQSMYLKVITARNKQAGRPDRAGTTKAYPDLAPPPPPPEPRKLRSHDQKGKTNQNRLGDLPYDLKATSFPKRTKDGRMLDSKGNFLLGITGDISSATKRRQPKPKQDLEQAPSPESARKNKPPLNVSVEEEEDPEVKQEDDADQEQGMSAPTTPEAKTNSPKSVLGPKFAGVCKLSGSSRRGVPRRAAKLRNRSAA